ncbi:hypothetical protein FRC11_007179, partial [Ceratobasidium sp. 423]
APYGYDENPERFTNTILPYSRLLWRYLLLPPISDAEEKASTDLHNLSTSFARLNNDKPVDVEDAKNILQAFNESLAATKPNSALHNMAMIRFVAPLVVPGCESLVPTTIKLSIDMLWDSLLRGKEAKETTILNRTQSDVIKALRPPCFNHQPWIWQIVDHVIREDLVDLALRAMLTAPSFNLKTLDHPEAQLMSAAIEFFMALKELAPHPDFLLRFRDSGRVGDLCKYYFYFRPMTWTIQTEKTLLPPTGLVEKSQPGSWK